jgi:hypothetical protein
MAGFAFITGNHSPNAGKRKTFRISALEFRDSDFFCFRKCRVLRALIFHSHERFETRFGGIARLYGQDGLAKLRVAHVCVVGIGGVGAWAAEALARSGLGALTLVDLDEVCASNINRQLHALTETVGRARSR